MWTCPTCGESHSDRFNACWKCAAAEIPRPTPPPDGPRLRPTGEVLNRTAIAFLVGGGLGWLGAFLIGGLPISEAMRTGLFVGVICACLAGIYHWVLFPYKESGETRGDDKVTR